MSCTKTSTWSRDDFTIASTSETSTSVTAWSAVSSLTLTTQAPGVAIGFKGIVRSTGTYFA